MKLQHKNYKKSDKGLDYFLKLTRDISTQVKGPNIQ